MVGVHGTGAISDGLFPTDPVARTAELTTRSMARAVHLVAAMADPW